ncbi:adenylyltransferase and sulfurtransferase [Cryptococcus wingfieldii CBS 7118]|uniref:Adenylyltransferase and sulfurtransferase n=1 Tax=Cryptococcus wingfieldii CBS 7118 TaxID=1295528 RepID=A0A1E3J6A1_9TREE|nr:adenylyltransferase and sulfurtransferase [Cryptococcus wingfieldii CBS 7118]ODN96387.1 adenylyltransferase and sulfurtransferase [Cryptococcus wingfieldii CBS 7118]
MSLPRRTVVQDLPLDPEEYQRYGRQMIMPGFGLPSQVALKNAKVAVVGAGGLGCPVLQYLAGSGVGTIGIFDDDTVSLSNLHRQILHTTDRAGMNKSESACLALRALNTKINLIPNPVSITPSTALDLLRPYTILLDCTDRPLTRYLLSDAAIRLDIALVSGAAISSAGQWAVYGGMRKNGARRACYRCIWPSVLAGSGGNGRCEELGVWPVVTGMIGVGMAGEAIKLILAKEDPEPLLHLHHLGSNPLIRSIRMKGPSPKCIACGPDATITDDLEAFGYDEFCSGGDTRPETTDETGLVDGHAGMRLSVKELDLMLQQAPDKTSLIDTRPPVEFGIYVPLATILSDPSSIPISSEMVFICRRGNDSQIAAAALRKAIPNSETVRIRDVRGGLKSWGKEIDINFPIY